MPSLSEMQDGLKIQDYATTNISICYNYSHSTASASLYLQFDKMYNDYKCYTLGLYPLTHSSQFHPS